MVDNNRVEGPPPTSGASPRRCRRGDRRQATQARGQMNRAAGSPQGAYGQAVDGVRSLLPTSP